MSKLQDMGLTYSEEEKARHKREDLARKEKYAHMSTSEKFLKGTFSIACALFGIFIMIIGFNWILMHL